MTSPQWTLFGFGDALADIMDVVDSNNQEIGRIVLNMDIPIANLNSYLTLYKKSVEVIELENFQPHPNEIYNFGFFVPQKNKLVEQLTTYDIKFSNLIHRTASLSCFSTYGEALLIGPYVIVTARTVIGNHIRLNRAVSIGHDCIIEDYTHIGPAATIAGYCRVGSGTFIGAGSVLKHSVTIEKNAVIGAGSVVVSNIPDNVIAFGCPAKVVRENIPISIS